MWKRLWQLFTLGLWLGSTVFGGVAAAYPVIRSKSVTFGWLTEEEVDGLYAVSVLLPGPSFLNLWGAVSTRVAGFAGAIAGMVGLMLPSFLLVVALTPVEQLPWVAARLEMIMQTVAWATAGLFVAIAVQGFRKLKNPFQMGVAVLVLAVLVTGIHPLVLLAASVAVGVLRPYLRPVRKEGV